MQTQLDNAHDAKCSLATEILGSFGKLRIQATGWSMLPTLWPGDILEIERVGNESISAGDIVLFNRDGRLFAHRLISEIKGIEGDVRFTTQGDGMPEPDVYVSSSQLLGKVCLICRGNRRFQPRSRLSFPERMLVAILRRSFLASRVLARLHSMRQLPQKQVAACQH